MITNKRRPVHLWHGWFEYISQLESLLAFNACKYVQELTRWSMLCTKKRWIVDLPSLPVGHLLSENCDKTRFVPNLLSLSWKATTCQVRNVQGAFLWTNPRSDFWSKITRIRYYHRKKKIPKMDFSLDNPSLQFACFNVVLKRWQVVFVFEEFPPWVCKKIVPQSPQDYCFYAAVNVSSIAMKVRRDHGLL